MIQFLAKLIEMVRRLSASAFQAAGWVAARMQSVQIDQRRGVILCLVFQVLVIVSLILAL